MRELSCTIIFPPDFKVPIVALLLKPNTNTMKIMFLISLKYVILILTVILPIYFKQ